MYCSSLAKRQTASRGVWLRPPPNSSLHCKQRSSCSNPRKGSSSSNSCAQQRMPSEPGAKPSPAQKRRRCLSAEKRKWKQKAVAQALLRPKASPAILLHDRAATSCPTAVAQALLRPKASPAILSRSSAYDHADTCGGDDSSDRAQLIQTLENSPRTAVGLTLARTLRRIAAEPADDHDGTASGGLRAAHIFLDEAVWPTDPFLLSTDHAEVKDGTSGPSSLSAVPPGGGGSLPAVAHKRLRVHTGSPSCPTDLPQPSAAAGPEVVPTRVLGGTPAEALRDDGFSSASSSFVDSDPEATQAWVQLYMKGEVELSSDSGCLDSDPEGARLTGAYQFPEEDSEADGHPQFQHPQLR